MTNTLKIIKLKGKEILPYLSDLAQLRIKIFKEYPYLYEGDLETEKKHFQPYLSCSESIIILAFNKNQIVAAATGMPLEFETSQYHKPFVDHGLKVHDFFYLGDFIILPEYRGQKILRRLVSESESAALKYGCHKTTLATIERAPNDPIRPKNYVPLNKIWQHFGYEKHSELFADFDWKDIGSENASKHRLVFWLKNLKPVNA